MGLCEDLEQYRLLTLNLIDEVKKDGELTELIKKREEVLQSINQANYDKEELKVIGNSLKLLELEEELKKLINKEQIEIKKQIDKLKLARQANMNYNSIENRARIFNKSI